MITEPADHANCVEILTAHAKAHGVDITVSTDPPLVTSIYTGEHLTCPHGVQYFYEPTAAQIEAWVAGGVQ